MKNEKNLRIFCGLFFSLLLFYHPVILSQNQDTARTYEYAEANQQCLKCHGQTYYYYYNDWLEKMIRERMNPYFVMDSAEFYESNHWNFRCTDCHSEDYSGFPHDGELRMEPKYECMDCHGGDDTYAKFNFEQIDEEFHKSVHSSKHSDDFTCWMCHNPHSYKISARSEEKLGEIIQYDNNICLSCHANISNYQLLTNLENPNILKTHNWLPNQVLHFKNVRCIECHTEISDNILVAHNVQPKENAVKRCVECHSKNSLLLASLYKYQFRGERSGAGFSNAAIWEQSYVIGANRNIYLNYASLIIFGCVILGIIIHAFLRIILKS